MNWFSVKQCSVRSKRILQNLEFTSAKFLCCDHKNFDCMNDASTVYDIPVLRASTECNNTHIHRNPFRSSCPRHNHHDTEITSHKQLSHNQTVYNTRPRMTERIFVVSNKPYLQTTSRVSTFFERRRRDINS